MKEDSTVWSTIAWYQAFSSFVWAPGPRGTRRSGASVPPGAVDTTRTPWPAYSNASAAVSARTAPVAGVLHRPRGGGRPAAALGRGVRHRVDAPGGHRADVDDRAATLLEQMRENSAAAPEGREQRAADLRLDLVLAVVGIGLGPDRAAHIVDQDVDPAETLVSLGHDPRAVVVPLEVSPDGDRLGAGGVELVAQLGDEFRAVDEGDAAALLGHPRGDPLADALRRPGHHGHLAVEAARMDHRSSLPR